MTSPPLTILVAMLAAALLVLPSGPLQADAAADFEQALTAARHARAKAAAVGGEWRDIGVLLAQAEEAARKGDYAAALDLAEEARRQGEAGYAQATSQSGLGLPAYMRGAPVAAAGAEAAPAQAHNRIAPDLEAVEVVHQGRKLSIRRGHDNTAIIPNAYLQTDRGCPPFCVQPMIAAEGVATLGELEVLDYLARASGGDTSILVVDSRTPDWVMRGTIPGSVNIPWTRLAPDGEAGTFAAAGVPALDQILTERFGARKGADGWDFSAAKTLVLFCNGIWCGQSSANIHTLLALGYPAAKLKWYRGGMQDWVSVGLTTVEPRAH